MKNKRWHMVAAVILLLPGITGCGQGEREPVRSTGGMESATAVSIVDGTPQDAGWEDAVREEASSHPQTRLQISFSGEGRPLTGSYYNAGYDGWGDITQPVAVQFLQELPVEQLRMGVDLRSLSKTGPQDVDIHYADPKDGGLGLTERIERIRSYGWEPVLAPSNNYSLPSYFHGTLEDWYQYNRDGSKTTGISDQMRDYAALCGRTALMLKEAGISGLKWETFFESQGHGYVVDLQYLTAAAIKEADPTAYILGPATFPGGSVEEGFLKPYLQKYGTDYLDAVTIHLYGTNDAWRRAELWNFETDILTVRSTALLDILIETPQLISETACAVRAILDDPRYNPQGKAIDIGFTEFDANAYSPYQRVPVNKAYPAYSPDSDCYINTNYFGGLYSAYCIVQAACSPVDFMFRFTTRAYYGLLDHDYTANEVYYRTPVYFSLRLLQEAAYLTRGAGVYPGACMEGPRDNAAYIVGLSENLPYISAVGVEKGGKRAVIVFNRSSHALNVSLTLGGITASTARRYVFSKHTTALFIGRGEGMNWDGIFQGATDDTVYNTCMEPVDTVSLTDNTYSGALDGYSYMVLQLD
mgnify:CR=1 FL=1